MGLQKIRRIGLGLFVIFIVAHLLLRETAYQTLKTWLGYGFILVFIVVLVLGYLNRYRP